MMGYLDIIDVINEISLCQGKSGVKESLRVRSPIHVCQVSGTKSS